MNVFNRLFCKHVYTYKSEERPITFLGITLWSQWKEVCTKCGKEIIVHSGSTKANK